MRFTLVILRALIAALLAAVTLAIVAVCLWHDDTAHAMVYGGFLAMVASVIAPSTEDITIIVQILGDKS